MQRGRAEDDQGGPGPRGGVYEWYTRGLELLGSGNAAAAAQLLSHAAAAEPTSRSIREALARAQFDARMYDAAKDSFRVIVDARPDDDYARFGLGLAAARLGELETAVEQLSLAVAMRPDISHYDAALRSVRATLQARKGEGGRR